MIKSKRISIFLSFGVTIGLIIGLIFAFHEIIGNEYFEYKMYRMVFYTLQHLVDKWIFIATLITVFIIALISLNIPIARYVTRPLIRLLEIKKKILFSDAVQLNIINREKFS